MGQTLAHLKTLPCAARPAWQALLTWLLACMFLGLAGCAQIPTTAAPTQPHWSGRLALQVEGQQTQSFSASFELQGSPAQGELALLSPLGTLIARLQWEPGQARLSARGETQASSSLEDLLLQATGTPIPVAALFDWLSGTQTRADGWQADLGALDQGRLVAQRNDPTPRTTLRIVLDL